MADQKDRNPIEIHGYHLQPYTCHYTHPFGENSEGEYPIPKWIIMSALVFAHFNLGNHFQSTEGEMTNSETRVQSRSPRFTITL